MNSFCSDAPWVCTIYNPVVSALVKFLYCWRGSSGESVAHLVAVDYRNAILSGYRLMRISCVLRSRAYRVNLSAILMLSM